MATKRNAVPSRVYSNEELEQVAREVIARASGLAASDFKKQLDTELKKSDKLVVAAALRLVARGECYRWVQAKKMRFFATDPFDALASAVSTTVATEPMTEATLKAQLEARHRGFGDLLKAWLKGALSRGDVFLHPPAKGSKLKRYGREPNVEALLKKVSAELVKALSSTIGQKVERRLVLEALAATLGVPVVCVDTSRAEARERFLVELFRLGLEGRAQGLLSVRELRGRLTFDKTTFDSIALELARDELVSLHYHDYPASLSVDEREELIAAPSGQYYVGIALRRTA
jgi:hypothetical protein